MKAKPKSDSRQAILDRLRSRLVDQVALPDLAGDGSIGDAAITYEEPVEQFMEAVQAVGATCDRVANLDAVQSRLSQEKFFTEARRNCVLAGCPGQGNVDLNNVTDPHELADLDFVVAMAEFGVAENGALWITDQHIHHRSAVFITQHLALLVSAQSIVNNMHEAYARIGRLERPFGVFISGPSKTADIEQSLVLGAHGCRSLIVLIVD